MRIRYLKPLTLFCCIYLGTIYDSHACLPKVAEFVVPGTSFSNKETAFSLSAMALQIKGHNSVTRISFDRESKLWMIQGGESEEKMGQQKARPAGGMSGIVGFMRDKDGKYTGMIHVNQHLKLMHIYSLKSDLEFDPKKIQTLNDAKPLIDFSKDALRVQVRDLFEQNSEAIGLMRLTAQAVKPKNFIVETPRIGDLTMEHNPRSKDIQKPGENSKVNEGQPFQIGKEKNAKGDCGGLTESDAQKPEEEESTHSNP